MANEWRATQRLSEPTGRKFSIQGTGNSRADALAELAAKAALTVGVSDGASMAGPLEGAEIPQNSVDAVYSDAVLVMRNAGGDIATVHLENISTVYALGEGQIDLTEADIIAFCTAYRDGDGNGGYQPFGGEYVA